MEKTITIGEKEVRLNNNVGWALIYKNQFGIDIIPTFMPMISAALGAISEVFDQTGKTEGITREDVMTAINGEMISGAMIKLSGLEFVDLINITWAMAKCADEDLQEPRIWIRQFDIFPVDVIGPAVFELIVKGLMTSKNLERLTNLMKNLMISQPSTSTQSSSPELKED